MTISLETGQIAAIITLYDPPPTLREALQRLLNQTGRVIIVDNGKNEDWREWALAVSKKVEWIDNPQNGLGKAQNLGIAMARQKGMKWVLLLDDDSLPEQDMIAAMQKEWEHLTPQEQQKIGVIGAHIREMALHRPALYIQPCWGIGFRRIGFDENTPLLRDIFYVCASGSLIPMSVIDEVGEMREDFFLYFIDTEFCLRLRQKGYRICAVRDAVMKHRIGHRSTHRLFGREVSTTNHGPQARYYMYRNRRRLWWEYGWREPAYVLFDQLRVLSEMLRIILFEGNKHRKICAAMCGLWGLPWKEKS